MKMKLKERKEKKVKKINSSLSDFKIDFKIFMILVLQKLKS